MTKKTNTHPTKRRNKFILSLFGNHYKIKPAFIFIAVLVFAAIGYLLLTPSHAVAGDINGDGTVNARDLTIMASNWDKTGQSFAQGDLNGDGVVNIRDLSVLARNWANSTSTDSVAPSVSITAPTSGSSIAGTYTITATASDNVGVTKVEFYQSGTLIGTDTTSPYSVSWNTSSVANGTHSLTAKAYDAVNNIGTSAAVSVTVGNGGSTPPPAPPPAGSWWKPTSAHSITWNWIIGNTPSSTPVPPSVYDIDGFDNSASTVTTIHNAGGKAICYIDVGTYEPGRSDLSLIPTKDVGSAVEGWPGEKWLNIADISGLTSVVSSRMNMCKSKGFDAIEPDNIDGYTNSTGFPLTAANQLAYNEFLATTAHNLGLSIGLKNDVDQTSQLVSYFDWALDEECNKYTECDTLAPFTSANKAVFNAEYTDDGETTAKFCSADVAAHINGVLFDLNLDGATFQACGGW